jgi:hypothetical protein
MGNPHPFSASQMAVVSEGKYVSSATLMRDHVLLFKLNMPVVCDIKKRKNAENLQT